MPNFLLAYHGGGMAPTEEEMQRVMAAWGRWFQDLGAAVTDAGAPVSRTSTVGPDGAADGGGANPVTGYSILQADDLEAAVRLAGTCPILETGGTVEVCEAAPMA